MSQSSHPATIAVAGIFVLLVAYIVVDPIVSREVFTEEPKRLFPALALIGVVAAGLAVSLAAERSAKTRGDCGRDVVRRRHGRRRISHKPSPESATRFERS